MVDEMFGPYRLDALLGQGGMGEVYRAVDTRKNGRRVALKRLPAGLAQDADFQQRFLREAELTAQLRDPHVIPIHDYGEIDGRPYLDMRLVDGLDLTTYLDQHGALPPSRAVEIVTQIASALDAAHRDELIHRDVNPNNVLLNRPDTPTSDTPGFVYLIDFGIAANLLSSTRRSSTAIVGTVAYMAPERFSRSGDHRVDVYALGCVLYKMLTGKPAFSGDDPVQIMAAHLDDADRPRPSTRQTDLPAGLDDVVVCALAKNPDDRYPSAGGLAQAARSALTPAAGPGPRHDSLVVGGSPVHGPASRSDSRPETGPAPDAQQSAPASPADPVRGRSASTVAPEPSRSGPTSSGRDSAASPAPASPDPGQHSPPPSRPSRPAGWRRPLPVAAAVTLVLTLIVGITTAVLTRSPGSGNQPGPGSTISGPGVTAAEGISPDAVPITATPDRNPLPAGTPGTGKPTIVIGSKNFAEQTVLGELYTQALEAKGFTVNPKPSIGGSELVDKALESNEIQMYPEYLGETVTSVAKLPAPTSASDTYNKAKQWLEANRGSTILLQTPFQDADCIIVTTQTAQRYGLENVADLSKIGSGGRGVTVSGPTDFSSRETGLVGMKRVYNLPNVGYLPVPAGSEYTAVDQGSAQAATAFTTDYQLTTGKYRLLSDPQAVFGYQYVAPIVKQDVLAAQGPEFAATLNWVSGLLSNEAIQALNQQVLGNNQPAGQVAQQFLAANGLA